ncbi:MAG: YceD family protein [Candidatus Aegiribacteria sp.]
MKLDTEKLALDMRSLSRGTNRGSFIIPLRDVEWSIEDVEPAGDTGVLDLTVDLEEKAVICTGSFDARFQTRCARCLQPAVFPVREEIIREYSWIPAAPEEEPRELISDSGELNVLEAVREAIILSIPGKPLCSSDCPGIDYI